MVEPEESAERDRRTLSPGKGPPDSEKKLRKGKAEEALQRLREIMGKLKLFLQGLAPKDWQTLAIFLGLIGGAITFFYHWNADIDARTRESRKPFLTLQLETYAKILPVTAKITRLWSQRNDSYQKTIYMSAVDDFWEFYLGVLAMVEDLNVERAMVLFGKSLIADERHPDSQCAKSKQDITLTLDHCARDSITVGWGLKKIAETTEYCTPERLRSLSRVCED
jgi:hypothetical protein